MQLMQGGFFDIKRMKTVNVVSFIKSYVTLTFKRDTIFVQH